MLQSACWPSAPAPPPASVQTAGWGWLGRNSCSDVSFPPTKTPTSIRVSHQKHKLCHHKRACRSHCDRANAHTTQEETEESLVNFPACDCSLLENIFWGDGGRGVTLQRQRLTSSSTTSTSSSTSTRRIGSSASTRRWS